MSYSFKRVARSQSPVSAASQRQAIVRVPHGEELALDDMKNEFDTPEVMLRHIRTPACRASGRAPWAHMPVRPGGQAQTTRGYARGAMPTGPTRSLQRSSTDTFPQ